MHAVGAAKTLGAAKASSRAASAVRYPLRCGAHARKEAELR